MPDPKPPKKTIRVKDKQTGKVLSIAYEGEPPTADEIDDIFYADRNKVNTVSPGMGDVKRAEQKEGPISGPSPSYEPAAIQSYLDKQNAAGNPAGQVESYLQQQDADRKKPMGQRVLEAYKRYATPAQQPDDQGVRSATFYPTIGGAMSGEEVPANIGAAERATMLIPPVAANLAAGVVGRTLAKSGIAKVAAGVGKKATLARIGMAGAGLAAGTGAGLGAATAVERPINAAIQGPALTQRIEAGRADFRKKAPALAVLAENLPNFALGAGISKKPFELATAAGLGLAQEGAQQIAEKRFDPLALGASAGVALFGSKPNRAGEAVTRTGEALAEVPGAVRAATKAYNAPIGTPDTNPLAPGTVRYTPAGQAMQVIGIERGAATIGNAPDGKPIAAKGASSVPMVRVRVQGQAGESVLMSPAKFMAITTAAGRGGQMPAQTSRIVKGQGDLETAFVQDWGIPAAQAKQVAARWHGALVEQAKRTGKPIEQVYQETAPGITQGGEQLYQDILKSEKGLSGEALGNAVLSDPAAGVTTTDPVTGRQIVAALMNPDATTGLHELGHVMRRMLTPAELDIVGQWSGARKDSTGKWRFDETAEEMFADAVEAAETRNLRLSAAGDELRSRLPAPFAKLAQGFARFATGIKGVSFPASKDKVNPEILRLIEERFGGNGDGNDGAAAGTGTGANRNTANGGAPQTTGGQRRGKLSVRTGPSGVLAPGRGYKTPAGVAGDAARTTQAASGGVEAPPVRQGGVSLANSGSGMVPLAAGDNGGGGGGVLLGGVSGGRSASGAKSRENSRRVEQARQEAIQRAQQAEQDLQDAIQRARANGTLPGGLPDQSPLSDYAGDAGDRAVGLMYQDRAVPTDVQQRFGGLDLSEPATPSAAATKPAAKPAAAPEPKPAVRPDLGPSPEPAPVKAEVKPPPSDSPKVAAAKAKAAAPKKPTRVGPEAFMEDYIAHRETGEGTEPNPLDYGLTEQTGKVLKGAYDTPVPPKTEEAPKPRAQAESPLKKGPESPVPVAEPTPVPKVAGEPSRVGDIEYADPKTIGVMPGIQFKRDLVDTKNNVTDQLKNVDTYNISDGGVLTVFERADGKRVVVDGHHRLELANRARKFVASTAKGEVEVPREVRIQVFKESDGWTPEIARAYGVRRNLIEGKGRAIDAADALVSAHGQDSARKFTAKLPKSAVIRDTQGLIELTEDGRSLVANGKVTEGAAAGVGKALPNDPKRQKIALDGMVRSGTAKTYDDGYRIGREVAGEDLVATNDAQMGLAGFDAPTVRSTAPERAAIKQGVIDSIKGQITDAERGLKTKTLDNEIIDVPTREKMAKEFGDSKGQAADKIEAAMKFDPTLVDAIKARALDVADNKMSKAAAIEAVTKLVRVSAKRSLPEIVSGKPSTTDAAPADTASVSMFQKRRKSADTGDMFAEPSKAPSSPKVAAAKAKAIQRGLFETGDAPMKGGTIRDESSLGGLFDETPAAPAAKPPKQESLFQKGRTRTVPTEGAIYTDPEDTARLRSILPGSWRSLPVPAAKVSQELGSLDTRIGSATGNEKTALMDLRDKLWGLSDRGMRDIVVVDGSQDTGRIATARREAVGVRAIRGMVDAELAKGIVDHPEFATVAGALPPGLSDTAKVEKVVSQLAARSVADLGRPEFSFIEHVLFSGYEKHGEAWPAAVAEGASPQTRRLINAVGEKAGRDYNAQRPVAGNQSGPGVGQAGLNSGTVGANQGGNTGAKSSTRTQAAPRPVGAAAAERAASIEKAFGTAWKKLDAKMRDAVRFYAATQSSRFVEQQTGIKASDMLRELASRGIAPPGKSASNEKGAALAAWIDNTKPAADGDNLLWAESPYEFARARELNADPNVKSYGRAPSASVKDTLTGRTFTYTPDFRIEYKDGRTVYEEVKPYGRLSEAEVVRRRNAAKEYYRTQDTDPGKAEYRFVTEAEIGKDRFEQAAADNQTYQYIPGARRKSKLRARLQNAGKRGETARAMVMESSAPYNLFQKKRPAQSSPGTGPVAPPAGRPQGKVPASGRSRSLSSRIIKEVAGIPREIMATADDSALLRQGVILSAAHPGVAGRAFVKHIQALNPKSYEALKADMAKSPRRKQYDESGLYLASLSGSKEESFTTRALGKIPGVSQVRDASERLYTAYLDTLRAGVADKWFGELEKDGKTFSKNRKEFEDAAGWINTVTGRGDDRGAVGKFISKNQDELGVVFFAPRFAYSRFQTMSPATYVNMSPAVRKMAARTLIRYVGLQLAAGALARAAGWQINLTDPDSSDFLKMRKGRYTYDLGGGLVQTTRFVVQVARGLSNTAKKIPNPKNAQPSEVALRYTRSKLSPVASYGVDFLAGKDYIGRPFDAVGGAKDRLAPMFARDLSEAIRAEGLAGAAAASPSFLGAGYTRYDTLPKRKERESPRITRAKQRATR
jgi:hypothetical protein